MMRKEREDATMGLLESLEKTIDPFRNVVIEGIKTLFQQTAVPSNDWTIVPRLINTYDLACALGASNARFSAVFAIGVNTGAIKTILEGAEEDERYYLDAIGELANTCSALLMSIPEVVSYFDILVQAPPVFCSSGQALYFPKVYGISGTVLCKGDLLWVGFAVR